ncbi:MAG: helix-turn-helix domain-containing protein [Lentimicrobium sp.]|jgi:AraC-like DNA-binding protein|nr:helix-turn-helix domain-containing protein [Lentimicrobium sp.]MDD2528668.1 helix-turn-helix domain-containing protein [Lentimicrobiaceae bacterium]MDD4598236.1 helix-turn-helix domain-containing protein [Lentimicrobiaceae bacterium]MDY0026867.1 helix-turn-helix domain-containing protein [Lentimicrobium sp.]
MENLYKGLFIVGSSALLLISMLALEKALRKENRARLYLVVFMVMAAIYYASFGVYFLAPSPYSEYGNIIRLPIVLSFIPLFFLFLRDSVTGTTQKFKYVVKHLILPVLFFASIPFLLIFSSGDELNPGIGVNVIHLSAQIILVLQTIFYTLRMFRRYSRYSGKLQLYYNEKPKETYKIRNLLVAFVLFLLVLDNWVMSLLIPPHLFNIVYPILLLTVASVTGWLGLITEPRKGSDILVNKSIDGTATGALKTADLVSERYSMRTQPILKPILAKPMEEKPADTNDNTDSHDNGCATFDSDKRKSLHAALIALLDEKEPYVDPKLNIKQLASDLDTNTRYLSIIINEFEECNFNQLINRYRVNKVIRLLVDNQAKSYSFFGLAQKAGFHSKSVFISSFKAQTGQTPTAFAASMRKLIQV